jgi:hypothetical protein
VRDGLPPGWTSINGIVGPGERVDEREIKRLANRYRN